MPLVQLNDEDISPRIIQIAGVYPGITADELMAPQSAPAARHGMWQFDFSDPDGPQMGTVALGPNNAVHLAKDPVVLVTQSAELGLSLSNDVETEVLVMLDRGETDFESDKFLAVAGPDGSVTIRWYDALPDGYSILGRVVYVTIPYLSSMATAKSGFAEDDDGFNF